MPDPQLVDVYDSQTGEKRQVPAHWPNHKVLGQGIRKTPPSQNAAASTTQTPAAGEKQEKS